jgi:hypothetical protein
VATYTRKVNYRSVTTHDLPPGTKPPVKADTIRKVLAEDPSLVSASAREVVLECWARYNVEVSEGEVSRVRNAALERSGVGLGLFVAINRGLSRLYEDYGFDSVLQVFEAHKTGHYYASTTSEKSYKRSAEPSRNGEATPQPAAAAAT